MGATTGLGIIFEDLNIMRPGDGEDLIHTGSDAHHMDGNYRFCLFGNFPLKSVRWIVQRTKKMHYNEYSSDFPYRFDGAMKVWENI